MTNRPSFWLAVVLLSALFAATLAYKAEEASVGDVVAWFVAVVLLTGALMTWAGRES